MSLKEILKKSRFRSSFKLNKEDITYIDRVGFSGIEAHTEDFITKRLVPANPKNDGKQTPFKGHPVFKAQHATATCCRGCLSKWHKIPKNKPLNKSEILFIKGLISNWIKKELPGERRTRGTRRPFGE